MASSLESSLRSFACLTKGDVFAITYNDKVLVSFNHIIP